MAKIYKNSLLIFFILGATIKSSPLTCTMKTWFDQDFFKKALMTLQDYKSQLIITGVSAVATAYVAHALYLDNALNDSRNLWHWALHENKEGVIDQEALIHEIKQRYPDLDALHPLTAIFAIHHETQQEIDRCIELRGMIKTLNTLNLGWIVGENLVRLDKKLENLYILKITLLQCVIKTRSRCKKQAQL